MNRQRHNNVMNGFEKRKEKKKECIRQAASELFRQFGFKKVSLHEIARAAGVSHVTIYNHFGSKKELEKDILNSIISNLIKNSLSVMRENRPFPEKVELLINRKVTVAGQYQGELLSTALKEYPEMKKLIEDLWNSEIEAIQNAFVMEGKQQGYIRADLSDAAVKIFFEIIRRGVYANPEIIKRTEGDTRIARDINELFVYGLVQRPACENQPPANNPGTADL
ncbi:MAG: TetR/AcrR family transcriptional regulator [Dehalococcoidales bacterium]|nr:TetR/AcrR family transcriptional regulator [Dehalococcoidales bacterium]